jgi:hypothetical protein
MDDPNFEAWFYDEVSIMVCEIDGPNSPDYDLLHDRFTEDETLRETMLIRYSMLRDIPSLC